jgi:hypothetical protein
MQPTRRSGARLMAKDVGPTTLRGDQGEMDNAKKCSACGKVGVFWQRDAELHCPSCGMSEFSSRAFVGASGTSGDSAVHESWHEPGGYKLPQAWMGYLGLIIFLAVIGFYAYQAYIVNMGNVYGDLQDRGAPHASAFSQAASIGIGATILTAAVPVGLLAMLHLTWTPKTRVAYSLRFAGWPCLFFSTQLGGPLAQALAGHSSRYMMDVGQTLKGLSVLSLVGAPIAFGLGWLISRLRSPSESSGATPFVAAATPAAGEPAPIPVAHASRSDLADSGGAADPATRLERLKQLLDRGAITQEDYTAKKREILEEL